MLNWYFAIYNKLDVKEMKSADENVTVEQAIRRGQLYVNGPVTVLMLAPMAVPVLLFDELMLLFGSAVYVLLAFCFCLTTGFLAGWSWWAYAIPRWRVWAYERVEDIPLLKVRAVQARLTWPDGHVFGRTEFKSAEQATRQRELEDFKGRSQ